MGALYSWPFEVSTVESGMVKVMICLLVYNKESGKEVITRIVFTNYRLSSCHSRIKSLDSNKPGVLVLVSRILGVPDKALLPHKCNSHDSVFNCHMVKDYIQ